MNCRELFALLIKAMGVFELVGGLEVFPQYLRIYSQPASFPGGRFPVTEILWTLGFPGLKIIAGVILFLGANWLARRVYPMNAQVVSSL